MRRACAQHALSIIQHIRIEIRDGQRHSFKLIHTFQMLEAWNQQKYTKSQGESKTTCELVASGTTVQ